MADADWKKRLGFDSDSLSDGDDDDEWWFLISYTHLYLSNPQLLMQKPINRIHACASNACGKPEHTKFINIKWVNETIKIKIVYNNRSFSLCCVSVFVCQFGGFFHFEPSMEERNIIDVGIENLFICCSFPYFHQLPLIVDPTNKNTRKQKNIGINKTSSSIW